MSDPHAVDLLVTLERGASSKPGEGLTHQLYSQLRAAILSGRLRAGERLPATRVLAHQLGVARLTVATAYDWLRAEGYVYGQVGAGTFVAPVFNDTHSGSVEISTPASDDARKEGSTIPDHFQITSGVTPVPLSAWAHRIAHIPLLGAGSGPEIRFD